MHYIILFYSDSKQPYPFCMPFHSRETRQRSAIRNALKTADKPLQPKEIQDIASRTSPKIGLATIYRNLKKLEEEGLVEAVHLPGLARCYASPRKPGAILLYCEDSGRAEFLPADSGKVSLPPLPKYFKLQRYDLVLRGTFGKRGK